MSLVVTMLMLFGLRAVLASLHKRVASLSVPASLLVLWVSSCRTIRTCPGWGLRGLRIAYSKRAR